jgi:hypothetical protein
MSLWDEVGSGLNIDTEDHDRVRCARCGFPCVLSRDSHFPEGSRAGWGLRYDRFYIETTITGTAIDETPSPVTTGIYTEDGIPILTEDGQFILPE